MQLLGWSPLVFQISYFSQLCASHLLSSIWRPFQVHQLLLVSLWPGLPFEAAIVHKWLFFFSVWFFIPVSTIFFQDILNSSSYHSFTKPLFQDFECRSKCTNCNRYHHQLHVPQNTKLSDLIQGLFYLLSFLYFNLWSFGSSKSIRWQFPVYLSINTWSGNPESVDIISMHGKILISCTVIYGTSFQISHDYEDH